MSYSRIVRLAISQNENEDINDYKKNGFFSSSEIEMYKGYANNDNNEDESKGHTHAFELFNKIRYDKNGLKGFLTNSQEIYKAAKNKQAYRDGFKKAYESMKDFQQKVIKEYSIN